MIKAVSVSPMMTIKDSHTALGGQPPASRVPNLSGQYTYGSLNSDIRRKMLALSGFADLIAGGVLIACE
jgi:hypothetical protein